MEKPRKEVPEVGYVESPLGKILIITHILNSIKTVLEITLETALGTLYWE